MSEPIVITGEWRTMKTLTPGVWIGRLRGFSDTMYAMSISHECNASPGCEYLGPLEIVYPEPEPTPFPGCRCDVISHEGDECCCQSFTDNGFVVMVHGDTRRQAILRHNAAVAAIMEMEKLT